MRCGRVRRRLVHGHDGAWPSKITRHPRPRRNVALVCFEYCDRQGLQPNGGTRSVASASARETATTERGPPNQTATTERSPPNRPKNTCAKRAQVSPQDTNAQSWLRCIGPLHRNGACSTGHLCFARGERICFSTHERYISDCAEYTQLLVPRITFLSLFAPAAQAFVRQLRLPVRCSCNGRTAGVPRQYRRSRSRGAVRATSSSTGCGRRRRRGR